MPNDDLDVTLVALQQSLANLATMASSIVSIRRNADRLLEPLKGMLEEARDAIDQALPHV
jgi:hypothetical protein